MEKGIYTFFKKNPLSKDIKKIVMELILILFRFLGLAKILYKNIIQNPDLYIVFNKGKFIKINAGLNIKIGYGIIIWIK